MDRRLFSPNSLNLAAPVAVVIAFIVVTLPALSTIGSRWSRLDESYSHGFLLLLIAAFLFVRTWREHKPTASFYPLWTVPLLGALILYGIGDILMIQALQQLFLIPLLLGGLAIIWGWQQVKYFIVPVGILFFAVPVWDYLSLPLQLITVAVNQVLLSIPGIEFEVEGVFVYLIGVGAFEIAHGCSGLRYLLVGLTLAFLYGELNFRHLKSKFLMVAAAIFFALLANWIRVFIIIYMGYITDMETGLIEDHDSFGWWVFAGTLVPLFLFGRWLEKRPSEAGGRRAIPDTSSLKSPTMRGLVAVSGLFLVTAAVLATGQEPGDGETRPFSFSPLAGENWSPLFQRSLRGWEPRVLRPDWMYRGTYFNTEKLEPGEPPSMTALVGLYTYEHQRAGREVIQYGNRLYDSSLWLPERRFTVNADHGAALRGMELRMRGSEERLYIVYGYYVEGRWETDQVRAKLAQLHGVFNRRSDASLLAIGVHCANCDGVKEVSALAGQLQPKVQQQIDGRFGG